MKKSTLGMIIAVCVFSGCDNTMQPETITKEVFTDQSNLDLTGIEPSSINMNCYGEVATRGLDQRYMQNSFDIEFVDYKTVKSDKTSTECEARYLAINNTQGIFGQELVKYKLFKDQNGTYKIGFMPDNLEPKELIDKKLDQKTALDFSCNSTNAKTLLGYTISNAGYKSIGIDNIITREKNTNSSKCEADITIYNDDLYAADSERVIDIQHIKYEVVKTDDNNIILNSL